MSLVNQYRSSLKVIEAEEFTDLLFFRPLAFLFVKLIYPTNLTPNQITLLSLLFGILAGISIAIATLESIFLGAFFLILWTVLDCADGQLARLKKNGTPFGRLLDGIVDYTTNLTVMIGICFWGRTYWDNPFLWCAIVIVASLIYAWQEVLVDFYRSEYISNAGGKSKFVESELAEFQAEYDNIKNISGQKFKKIILALYIKYSNLQDKNKRECQKENLISPDEYVRANRNIIQFWNINGTSTHAFALIIFAFINRFDLFIWYILLFGNLWTLIMWFIQKDIDRKTKKISDTVPSEI